MQLNYRRSNVFLCLFLVACCWLCARGASYAQEGATEPYSVAILDFDTKEHSYSYGGSVISPQTVIPAVLTTELAKSDRFTVVEREALESVLKEQKLGSSGTISAETAASLGEVLGVNYLIVGKVTEFNVESGKKQSFSIMGMGGSSKKADSVNVSIELKVLDTESARIVAVASCRRSVEIGKGSGSTSILGISSSSNDNNKQDSAMTDVYYTVDKDLATQLETVKFKLLPAKVKYTGFVAGYQNNHVYINLGKNHNITKKMVFLVRRENKNGVSSFKTTIGEIQVINVDEESSECKILNKEEGADFKKGDLVETKM